MDCQEGTRTCVGARADYAHPCVLLYIMLACCCAEGREAGTCHGRERRPSCIQASRHHPQLPLSCCGASSPFVCVHATLHSFLVHIVYVCAVGGVGRPCGGRCGGLAHPVCSCVLPRPFCVLLHPSLPHPVMSCHVMSCHEVTGRPGWHMEAWEASPAWPDHDGIRAARVVSASCRTSGELAPRHMDSIVI